MRRIAILAACLAPGACQSLLDFRAGTVIVVTDAAVGVDVAPGPADARHDPETGRMPCDGATFCDDFDQHPLGGLWDDQTGSGATLELEPSDASPPNALLAALRSPDTTGSRYLKRDLGRVASITCAFDIKVTLWSGPEGNYCDVLWLQVGSPDVSSYVLLFALHDENDVLTAGVREDIIHLDGATQLPASTLQQFGLPEPGRWVRVTLATDFKTLSLKYGNLEMLPSPIMAGLGGPKDVVLNFGISANPSDPVEIRYDNLACTVIE